MMLLIDERPEEVTDIRRSVAGEVVYSTFDAPQEHHVRVSEMVYERAQRLVEQGQTSSCSWTASRASRAPTTRWRPAGGAMSGGLAPGVLQRPKRFFGAARNVEGGGSLTIIATALVETGSRMDDIIYEEFKGHGQRRDPPGPPAVRAAHLPGDRPAALRHAARGAAAQP